MNPADRGSATTLRGLERLAVEARGPWLGGREIRGDKSALARARDTPSRLAVFADQLARDAAVLREHQQSGRVDIEPACRCEASQQRGIEACGCGPPLLRRGSDERHRRLIAVFGLARDVAERLVQQNR